MMRRAARFFTLFAFAAMLSGPVFTADVQASGLPTLSAEELTQIEKMLPAQRDAYIKQQRENFAKLPPAEQQKRLAARKAAYDALSTEEQDQLQARMEALRQDSHRRHYERMKGSKAHQERKMKAFLDTLTPEQREMWKEMADERKKWEHPGFDLPEEEEEDGE